MSLSLFVPASRRAGAGPVRRILSRLGPSWLASPVRRGVQTLSLLLFLVLFFYVCWPYGSRHHAREMARREVVAAETFLALDPLVGASAALASRTLAWPLVWTGIVVAACLVVPRGFCGYVCPFGTLIDLFDRIVGRRRKAARLEPRPWWAHLKYGVLAAVLAAAALGTMLAGFVAAIPVLTRGMLYTFGFLQLGLLKGWYLVPPLHAGHYVSVALFLVVFGLCFLTPRFWCRYLCPSGAVLSVASVTRLTERRVGDACIGCGKCVAACPFDAIRPDFTTRTAECTFCQTCGGVCPVHAITFGARWAATEPREEDRDDSGEGSVTRRRFAAAAVGAVAGAGASLIAGGRAEATPEGQADPVRPPGSVPERDFLRLCVRCGECIKACPYNVLQPMGFERGIDGLWTPQVVADGSGCEPTCTNCGQVCPTGAIRALPLAEKRAARIGLAVVDEAACLPHAGREACEMCADECTAAGLHAIEFIRVGVEVDEQGMPVPDTGFRAPVVVADKCNGCGLCQSRCRHINADQKKFLAASAIVVVAGPGKEDRLRRGSYLALRENERRRKQQTLRGKQTDTGSYLPDFLK